MGKDDTIIAQPAPKSRGLNKVVEVPYPARGKSRPLPRHRRLAQTAWVPAPYGDWRPLRGLAYPYGYWWGTCHERCHPVVRARGSRKTLFRVFRLVSRLSRSKRLLIPVNLRMAMSVTTDPPAPHRRQVDAFVEHSRRPASTGAQGGSLAGSRPLAPARSEREATWARSPEPRRHRALRLDKKSIQNIDKTYTLWYTVSR
jgi:hypothetical protein